MTHPVPLLDLAPKRKTPLSLWNPLDYLVLLYWILFFPQAIMWYVETFRKVKDEDRTWRGLWQLLGNDSVQRKLSFQALLLIPLTTIASSLLSSMLFSLSINWFGVILLILLNVGLGIVGYITRNINGNLAQDVVYGTTIGIVMGVGLSPWVIANLIVSWNSEQNSIFVVTVYMIGLLTSIGTASSVTAGVKVSLGRTVTICALFCIISCILFGLAFGPLGGAQFSVIIFIISTIFLLRLPDFLMSSLPAILRRRTQQIYILPSRVTFIKMPNLYSWLSATLRENSVAGLQNINQLLRYSMQFIPIVDAVNDWLAKSQQEEVYKRVNALVEPLPYDWKIIQVSSAPLSTTMYYQAIFFLPKGWRKRGNTYRDVALRTDTPARAACAGYWLLHEKDTAEATEAFAHNRPILYGETLYQSARILDLGHKVQNLQNIVAWESESQWLTHLNEEPLRPQAIATLRRLRGVAREASVAAVSYSKLNRNAALGRAVATLTEILDDLDTTCPELERPIVREIAEKWRDILAREAGKAGQITITEPVENPFVVGNPVSGAVFVGREEILGRIEELWGNGATQSVPSLVIFGHRRMGKSSILQNLGERRFGVNTIVAQFTMQRAGRLQNTGELLGIFATCMHEALSPKGIHVPEPDFAIFERSPYQSFNSFLAAVKRQVTGQRVILTIDEFELIEDAIQKKAVDAELLSYLRGVIHSEHWFVLALAGLHTLEEMTADYWNPLFSSVTPVRVSFLSWEATANLLANPTDDFPLDFTREAIDCVYTHVKGQPFLTQLIGHTLVRLYNQSVFENQNPREPRFSAADVDEVVGRPEFYEQGHYYFQGVWSQAQSGPHGQLTLLRALAQADGALSLEEWRSAAGVDASLVEAAVNTLLQHDVVLLTPEGHYDFAVPLMRRWLRK